LNDGPFSIGQGTIASGIAEVAPAPRGRRAWLRETHATQPPALPLGDALAAREREMIEAALADARGKVSGRSGVAARLGLPPSTLESKIRALKIRKDHYEQP